jgi:hypothetical protein
LDHSGGALQEWGRRSPGFGIFTKGTFGEVVDAEFLDSEFGSNRYRVSAFEHGTWLDVVASTLMLQFREEGHAVRH